jgi:regulator of replication initiation timing
LFKKKNDQVFPTSLSEIAFVLVFLLMLLLGYMIIKEMKDKEEAQQQLAKIKLAQSVEVITAAMQQANTELTQTLTKSGHLKPAEVISRLTETAQVRAERDALRDQLAQQNERLTALTALREQIKKAGDNTATNVIHEEVESALTLQNQIRQAVQDQYIAQEPSKDPETPSISGDNKQAIKLVKTALETSQEVRNQIKIKLERDVKPGDEPGAVRTVVDAAKNFEQLVKNKSSPEALKKENSDLRGQLAYVTRQLNAKGGLDHAPCWANEKGKIEYLFNVETRPDGFVVSKGWLPHREQAARALPGISEALSGGTMSYSSFSSRMQPILNWSKKQDPECRHFVYLATVISDGDARDNARKQVEGFFYKLEVKR